MFQPRNLGMESPIPWNQVASFGPYLWKRNVIALSFAHHEAEVQVLVLTYGSDMAHCSRCLTPWGSNDGKYIMEIDRVLKPGTRKSNRVRVLEVEVIRWRLLNNFMMRSHQA
ncbi:probable methyltransferase PMT2 isoform X3 [Lactuca sativa]|uniref:probable methyltransferase PMT2 isoform X3 n=1 Tax=Lactuca sativa TaxID=4236 RepID=UPI000CD98107|nr:probable methyltransferase PMT2 isoform X3 [Lactuca sativa]XP_052623009.1 probable methyltransferase PMT2 isoform X3 [Lactuca sativa]